jgi:hypothetical protein
MMPHNSRTSPKVSTEAMFQADAAMIKFLRGNRSSSSYSRRDWFATLVLYPLLIGTYAIFLSGTHEGGRIVSAATGDIAYYWLWARTYLGECLRNGILPHWNPYMMSGTPYLASNQMAIFYPPNWTFAVGAPAFWLNTQIFVHWWAALAAMHWLARGFGQSPSAALIAALVFGFSGFAILHAWQGHLPFILEMPWTPLVLVAWLTYSKSADRSLRTRLTLVLGVAGCLAMQFLAGHPQIVYFSLIILAWFHFWYMIHQLTVGRKKRALGDLMLFGASLVFAALLAAVQALPTAKYAAETVRAHGAPLEYYTAQSMPLGNILTLIAPWVWGGRRFGISYIGMDSYWEVAGFVGATAVLLAGMMLTLPKSLNRFQWTCLGLVAFALLLAFGHYSGFYETLMKVFPGLGLFRNPGRFLYIATFALALLAGEGLDRLIEYARLRPSEFLLIVRRTAIAVAGGIGAFLILFGDNIRSPLFLQILVHRLTPQVFSTLSREDVTAMFKTFRENLIASGIMAGLSLGLISRLIWAKYEKVTRRIICVFLFFELIQFARPYAESFSVEGLRWPSRLVSIVRNAGSLYRIASAREPSDLTQGMVEKIRHVWGYEPTVSLRYAMAMSVAQGRPPSFPEAWLQAYRISPLMNALGTRYLIAPPDTGAGALGWHSVFKGSAYELFENPDALPRAFCVGKAETTSTQFLWSVLSSPDFAPQQKVILEEEAARTFDSQETTGTIGKVEVLRDDPELFTAKVKMEHDGWFVLMDQYLPGWEASVNGVEAKIYRANGVGRALPLQSGEHIVEMRYVTPGWRTGLFISSIAWICYALLAVVYWRVRKARIS